MVIADARHERQIIERAKATDGVADPTPLTEQGRPGSGPTRIVDGKIRVDVTLKDAADSDAADSAAAKATVSRMRSALHRVDGTDALVGGYTAQQYDTRTTAERDRMLIVPLSWPSS